MAGANWGPGSSSRESDDSNPLFIRHEYSAMLLYGIRFKVFEGGQVGLLFWPHVKLQSHPQFSPFSILPSVIPAFSFPSLDSGYFILLCFSSGGSGIWSWPCIFCMAKNNLALLTLRPLPTNFWHRRHVPPRLLHASQVRIKPKASRKVSKHSTNWPAPAACLNLRIDSWLSIVDSKEAVLLFRGVTVQFISGRHALSALG